MVQGFGSMGGATARYLARAGVPVVGVCDVQGVVHHPDGLDVERLLLSRDAYGCVDRAALRSSDAHLAHEEWLGIEAEILVPAAMSYVITESNVDRVRARVVEAANMPTTPAAQAALAARGVTVVPDFIANVATNAWWWWTLFGDIEPTAQAAFAKISETLRGLVGQMLDRVERGGLTPRAAALAMSAQKAAALAARFGGD